MIASNVTAQLTKSVLELEDVKHAHLTIQSEKLEIDRELYVDNATSQYAKAMKFSRLMEHAELAQLARGLM